MEWRDIAEFRYAQQAECSTALGTVFITRVLHVNGYYTYSLWWEREVAEHVTFVALGERLPSLVEAKHYAERWVAAMCNPNY